MKNIRNVKPRHKKVLENDSQEEKPLPVKKQKLKHFPNFPEAPAIPPGEDEASCVRHIKLLQLEHQKPSPDKHVVLEHQKPSPDKHVVATLMSRTFAFRRREIIEQPKPIPQILKTYPSLKKAEQVRIRSYT